MQFNTPQIVWHDNVAPIYSVDFQQSIVDTSPSCARFATGGRDSNIRIWNLKYTQSDDAKGFESQVEYRATLSRHERTVNVVRFSKKGDLLASGSDDCTIVIWQQAGTENIAARHDEVIPDKKTNKRPVILFTDDSNSFFEPERDQLEKWQAIRVLRAHVEDVYDVAWHSITLSSKCSETDGESDDLLLTGSMDGSTILWQARSGRKICNVKNHDGYVQGVAVDPRGNFAASISSDRSLLLYRLSQVNKDGSCELSEKFERVAKALLPKVSSSTTSDASVSADKQTDAEKRSTSVGDAKVEKRVVKLFHDDSWKSFFRRLTFSPDGELLVVPSGVYPMERRVRVRTQVSAAETTNPNAATESNPNPNEYITEMVDSHVCYVLSRVNNFAIPFAILPTDSRPAIAIRFCPLRFALRCASKRNASLLPSVNYRWIFAVLTSESILFYDTEQCEPFAYATDLHYGTLNDVAWCVSLADGVAHVLICSTDGYCSTIVFKLDELGRPIVTSGDAETVEASKSPCEAGIGEPVKAMSCDEQKLGADVMKCASELTKDENVPSSLNTSFVLNTSINPTSQPGTPTQNSDLKKRRITLTTIVKPDGSV